MIRSYLVKALYDNLLGPMGDVDEIIEEPFLKYEMGILNSSASIRKEDFQAPSSDARQEQKDEDDNVPDPKFGIDSLDPIRHEVDADISFKTGAISLGIQFVLSGNSPKFKICLTWARYERIKESGKSSRMFKRHPYWHVKDWLDVNSKDVQEEIDVEARPGAFLHIIKQRITESDRWIIRVFLENRTKYDDAQKEEDRIFQPQIRVIADEDSKILELSSEYNNDKENEHDSDDILYRKGAKARGYMCAAVWKEVDPEIDPEGEIGKTLWRDRESVPKEIREEFTNPHVRTEYLPIYTVLQPEKTKNEFKASELSNMWDPVKIGEQFTTIVEEYSEWIEEQKQRLNQWKLDDDLKRRGYKNLEYCNKAKQRIENGINFLKTSEKARAAFCFMNEVMNRKRLHEKNRELSWREFQMAFILQSLTGVAGESKEERAIADILWFPTGGGKTEAYLGLVIFALAYRRLTPGGEQSNDGGVSVISRYTLRLLTIQQFERALGAIIAADMMRVENWLPAGISEGSEISDSFMADNYRDGAMWGKSRFSIGMWIGTETTPKDFAYRSIRYGEKLLNCEGSLLPHWRDDVRRSSKESSEPAQIQRCPVCDNTLCLSESQVSKGFVELTWIIKTQQQLETLTSLSKENFIDHNITVKEKPIFRSINDATPNTNFYRMTLEISTRRKDEKLTRRSVDAWWKDTVQQHLDPDGESFTSTAPAMPGYFFLYQPGCDRPHDFAIFCTNVNCELNKMEWFEKIENKYDVLVPEPFSIGNGRSRSVPISAYTIDEQIYAKCPSFIIATVDKFANLPFVPNCGSLFGNVDVVHPIYGYGRRPIFQSPLWKRGKNKRVEVRNEELTNVSGFNPPSLILQDELHLIEGPLGSMVGAYELAVDILADNGTKPKYIASSATIKETKSQVGTIFRRGISIFPPSGIDSSDTHFSKINEDIECTDERSGRLYLGIATTKSTVTLPIKAQSIIMSEIFKIKVNPGKYKLTDDENSDLNDAIDPYWTFVSYFTDLQLLAKFTNYYAENIIENVAKLSTEKIYNFTEKMNEITIKPGLRIFSMTAMQDMNITSISVYTSAVGRIKLAIYDDDSIGNLLQKFEYVECLQNETIFHMSDKHLHIGNGKKIWIAIINDNSDTLFQTNQSNEEFEQHDVNETMVENFPDKFEVKNHSINQIRISLNSSRILSQENNIVLSSETRSEDLVTELDRLKDRSVVDSLQTSPVFGTGIDVDRLGIMEVMNQPKTNSGYIQSTGRVGRTKPGLVINWLRAGRARDLNHYENFIGYHRILHKFVEPVTASPFSKEAMELCLGPILVSILRNSKKIMGTAIDPAWIDSEGPLRMAKHRDDPDVLVVCDALEQIASSDFIAEFRRMSESNFKQILGRTLSKWKQLAGGIAEKKLELKYDERNPYTTPTQHVVLGTPNHKHAGKLVAYENTPNSLRSTESTSAFYGANDIVPIRPSQFITRYGPGSLISGKSIMWIVPKIQDIISNLNGNDEFEDSNSNELGGIRKYEINDYRMKRILHRLLPKIDWKNLRLFSLPSNSSLIMGEFKKLYKCMMLSYWAICYDNSHHKKVLGKITFENDRMVVKCPECKKFRDNPNSIKFYNVRYYAACKNGHLGDINWKNEVHLHTKAQCPGNVFEWGVTGGNDNVRIRCLGHWNQNTFVPSKCSASVTHVELKMRSKSGKIDCTGEFAEARDKQAFCERIDGKSQAKMISKSQMSLRMSMVATSMEIQSYQSRLFKAYAPIVGQIDGWTMDKPRPTKDEFINFLDRCMGKEGFDPSQIRLTKEVSETEFYSTLEELKKSTSNDAHAFAPLTEYESLEEEISSLENQTRDSGTGVQVGPDDPPTDRRFPIKFETSGIHFEAMPFGKIEVTQVQTGYTREIPLPENIKQPDDQDVENDMARMGKPVRFTAKYTSGKNVWHLANQLSGEGIFIHLDPDKHHNIDDIFKSGNSNAFKEWDQKCKDTIEKNKKRINEEKKKEDNEQTIDALEMENAFTDPLFVWWHSFAHELINQLAIDSGFTGVSLGERIYCVRTKTNQMAGVFIYAASPGADGTLGGLTSLVDKNILPKIVVKTLHRIKSCSNDPLCSNTQIHPKRRTGAACHACLMNSETSCAYRNRFLDRNIVLETMEL